MNIDKKKVLIINQVPQDDYSLIELNNNGYKTVVTFKEICKAARLIRKIWIKFNIPFEEVWYGSWKKDLQQYELIILHVSKLTVHICEYINLKNPNAQVIAWYWNSIVDTNTCLPTEINGNRSVWSFDNIDCKKYGINFNHQYYCKSYVLKHEVPLIYDIYFVGVDKGRTEQLLSLYYTWKDKKLNVLFQIVGGKNKELPDEVKSNYLDYRDIRINIKKSKAILEIVQEGQGGPSLRTMEAIFFDKKLITNNAYIVNEEFFCEQNIFVLGIRDINEIDDFLKEKSIPYDRELKEKYDVDSWVNNFVEEKELS